MEAQNAISTLRSGCESEEDGFWPDSLARGTKKKSPVIELVSHGVCCDSVCCWTSFRVLLNTSSIGIAGVVIELARARVYGLLLVSPSRATWPGAVAYAM